MDPRVEIVLTELRELRAEVLAIGKSLASCQGSCARPAENRSALLRTVVASTVSGLLVLAGALALHLR